MVDWIRSEHLLNMGLGAMSAGNVSRYLQYCFMLQNKTTDSNISVLATELSLLTIKHCRSFWEETVIPSRFSKNKKSIAVTNKNDERFEIKLVNFTDFVITLFNTVPYEQAWRFIRVDPIILPQNKSAAQCQDFIDFVHYFIRRRDVEMCDAIEVGNLADMCGAIQSKIEKSIVRRDTELF